MYMQYSIEQKIVTEMRSRNIVHAMDFTLDTEDQQQHYDTI
jgi:hypothetical protein